MHGFELTKWYLDAVDAGGHVAIAYWGSLRALGAVLQWHNVTWYAPDAPPVERSTRRRAAPPVAEHGRVTAHNAALHWNAEYTVRHTALPVVLFDDGTHDITWHCHAAAAQVRFSHGDRHIDGAGYVERLHFSVPPWWMPFEELRWGRWISDDRSQSLVWIDWRGSEPRRWFLHNGAVVEGEMYDAHIRSADGELCLETPRLLHDRSVGALARSIRGLAPVSAHIPLSWTETKRLSRASWRTTHAAPMDGWAIHELVLLR